MKVEMSRVRTSVRVSGGPNNQAVRSMVAKPEIIAAEPEVPKPVEPEVPKPVVAATAPEAPKPEIVATEPETPKPGLNRTGLLAP